MTSFYGYNIAARGVKNPTALIEHVVKAKPRWLAVMDGLALAQQLQTASKETNVIHRNYGVTNGDDDVHKRYTPQAWLDLHKFDIDAGMWLMTTVEPGWSKEVIDWHVALMKLCIPDKIKLVIGNFSVGTPDPNNLEIGLPMFRLLDDHRDQFALGLHEYANAVITSGFVGGAPNGITESGTRVHPDYTQPGSWPLNGEARILTKWHCGRFQFITKYCQLNGINPPRIVLTETGFDDVSDIKWWSKNLVHTPPYADIGAYKTLPNYWRTIFPDWSQDKAYWKQMEYAENNIYANTTVEGGLFYCYGHIDTKWEPFDLEGHSEFLGYIEGDVVSIPTLPGYTPSAFEVGAKYTLVIAGAYRNLRDKPGLGTTGALIGQVNAGAEVVALEQRIVSTDYWRRIKVVSSGLEGWVSLDGNAVEMRRIVDPPDVIVLPPPSIPYPEVSAVYAKQMANCYASLAVTYRLMADDSQKTAEQWSKLAGVIEGNKAA